jgi:D-aspartate ligase
MPGAADPAARSIAQSSDRLLTEAVVVGAGEHCGGLGVVRSLGQAGVPVIVVDPEPSAPAMHSRFARRAMVAARSGPALIKDLLDLRATTAHKPVLFLTSDDAALTVSKYRADLEASYYFRLPTHERLTALMDKIGFQKLAETHQFAMPRSLTIERVEDFSQLSQLRFPCVLKPSVKTDAFFQKNSFGRGYKVATSLEAETIGRLILPLVPALVAQEWIAGDEDQIYFCLQYRGNDGPISSFTGRKLTIWPPDVGTTASCTGAPAEHAQLAALTEKFFAAVSFVGMGGIEFKRDPRSGQFLMIEPTAGRVDWQEEVATLHGINIPLAAYLYETGFGVPETTQAPGSIVWQDGWMQYKSARYHRGPSNRGPSDRSPSGRSPSGRSASDRSASDVTKPLSVYDAYWRCDDPLPAIYRGFAGGMRILRRIFNRGRAEGAIPGLKRPPPGASVLRPRPRP